MALINYTNEFGKLKKVALYKPRINEIYQGNPSDVMYVTKPDAEKVLIEFNNVVQAFRDLGIEVVLLEDLEHPYLQTTNMIFLRDVAAIIDNKIILANMKYALRKTEPRKFKNLFMDKCKVGENVFVELPNNMTMEGADIIVCNDSKILAYAGFRTSLEAVNKIASELQLEAISIPANNIQKVPQHLLGAVHIIAPGIIARRPRYYNFDVDGFEYLDFDETNEIKRNFAMNIVTIAPMEILMPSNCPDIMRKFEENGVRCHIVDIDEIHKMGGGLACMTLPLERATR